MQPQTTKYDQNASTNLDQDVNSSRLVKYAQNQTEIKEYLYAILSKEHPRLFEKYGPDFLAIDLAELLKDGEILCKLGSLLPASKVPNNPSTKFRSSKMPFVQMENISFFLSTCELVGLPHDEIFQTVDLYEAKDPYQVVITLMSFSRLANKIDASKFPHVVGARAARVKPNVPSKPFRLRTK
ncbi:uncharacterized protein CANTADRAFT_47999 [Suhomyces tanzawaensis NRRL Y-17324]|uniref:Calponin-homology (CH) domain-containing protein n=1 Tax=Suhomyces tanzawaensis NRRL Y-17324 TaxID=984487 RepID=A0A1E4SMC5_9ASCO|nr:uncharacterized protein CANTADRAFT_47999 [Suhomyces tanzawaensis NRRL Y-17324]ODV80679.1 hypothetical protein CANTADRAFT_47999 [Suhomyces tanzawaensis NRRL Y-17324]